MKKFFQVLVFFVIVWVALGAIDFVAKAIPFSILFPVGMGAIVVAIMENAAR